MAISDKNRKILWAKSGNRCAICKHVLVVPGSEMDADSLVGEECHIIARSSNGPRFSPAFPPDKVDGEENLILLCPTHHKIVDDQISFYTAEHLREIKSEHEVWVEAKLSKSEITFPRIRRVRIRENIPKTLSLVTSGAEILSLLTGCQGAYTGHDEIEEEFEVELVGGFLQDITDYMDLVGAFEPIEQVRAASRITNSIKELTANGFLVFVGSEVQRLEGCEGAPIPWKVLHLHVARSNNQSISTVNNGAP